MIPTGGVVAILSWYGDVFGHRHSFICSIEYFLYSFHGKSNNSVFLKGMFNCFAFDFKKPIKIILSRSCGAPYSIAFTSFSVKTYPAFLNLSFNCSKNVRCLAVRYKPFTFSNKKKSGFVAQISSVYVPESLPFSPSFPLFFPATEKSGQGGPPINPVRVCFFDSFTSRFFLFSL